MIDAEVELLIELSKNLQELKNMRVRFGEENFLYKMSYYAEEVRVAANKIIAIHKEQDRLEMENQNENKI